MILDVSVYFFYFLLKVQCVGSPIHKQQQTMLDDYNSSTSGASEYSYVTDMSRNLSMRSATSFGNHIMRIQSKMPTAVTAEYGGPRTNSAYDDRCSSSTMNMTSRLLNHKENVTINCLNASKSNDGMNYKYNKVKKKMSGMNQNDENINTMNTLKSGFSTFDMSANEHKKIGRGSENGRAVEMKSRARCRSAPVNRIRMLPKNERGVTTSSQTTTSILKNKIILPPKNTAPSVSFQRKVSAPVQELSSSEKRAQGKVASSSLRKISAPTISRSSLLSSSKKKTNNCSFMDGSMLTDLKIKTFHFQLEFEKNLKEK